MDRDNNNNDNDDNNMDTCPDAEPDAAEETCSCRCHFGGAVSCPSCKKNHTQYGNSTPSCCHCSTM